MARVDIKELATRYAHFGLYTTSAGGTELVVVRRKMGEPTDYLHRKSRKVSRQRANLALASQHWSHLTPTQKAYYRNQMDYVEVLGSPTEEKLLKGRQLFISREIRELTVAQKQLTTPFEVCIILVDEAYNPLRGQMWLFWKPIEEAPWEWIEGDQLIKGNFLFKNVKPGQFVYHPYGECEGYYDPETTWLTQDELRQYHYHILLDRYYRLVLKEPWTVEYGVPPMEQVILEPWTHFVPFPNLELVINEPWTGLPFPKLEEVITEPWTGGLLPPEMELVITEPWTGGLFPEMELVITEPWTGGILPPEFEEVITEPWTGALEQMFTSYTQPQTSQMAIYLNEWRCQTFLVGQAHKITYVTIPIRLGNINLSAGLVRAVIRQTDSYGRPTGPDRAVGWFNTDELLGRNYFTWVTFCFDIGYDLTQGALYAIVVNAPYSDGTHYILWGFRSQAPLYADGKVGYSSNGGQSWTMYTTADALFMEGGIPL